MVPSLEEEVASLAQRLDRPHAGRRAAVVQTSWWSERMIEWAMSHPSFKTELFRFVDVLPAMRGSGDVMEHLVDYFSGPERPRMLDLALAAAGHVPLGRSAAGALARHNVARVASQFIVGDDETTALRGLHQLWLQGSAFTVDILGERTVAEEEADHYARQVSDVITALAAGCPGWPGDRRLETDDRGPLPRINVSVKPSALASLYQPLTREDGLAQARSRLLPLCQQAVATGAFINVDMEQCDVRDLTLELVHSLLDEPELAGLHIGITVQAYLRGSARELAELIDRVAGRTPPITIRLVKGAYWDTEVVRARAEGWPVPVYERKADTDANFERCTRLLHDRHGDVRAAFGSHNARSVAQAIAYARSLGIPDSGYEVQTLFGMGGALDEAVRELGVRARVYAPMGRLLPGMAYLVRRLLENTSSESVIRQRFPHRDGSQPEAPSPAVVGASPPPGGSSSAAGPYRHEPVAEWRRAASRRAFASAVAGVPLGTRVPAIIDGREVWTGATIVSHDPGDTATVVATSSACGRSEVEDAVAVARRSQGAWAAMPVAARAAVLLRTAAWLRAHRHPIAALEVVEAGKPWREADADVCEAVDFCEYYARRALALDERVRIESPPGERNALRHQPRGVCAVIAPWNFPLAIPAGMVSAALVTGNTVVLKPAEQTPAVAAMLIRALRSSGLPDGVLSVLPGTGEDAGAPLVDHPEVSVIAFTGSREVGLHIVERAAVHQPGQRHVKRVIAEMGGKNAIVVDGDADIDQAIPIVTTSAFGHAGQKCSACSRLIVLDAVHDEVLGRLVGATRQLRVGHPREMGVQIGPLIDADAVARVSSYIARAPSDGTLALAGGPVPDGGHYVAPAIVDDVRPGSPLARDEIFGPVLAVLRAADLDEAIALANDTDYALTAGIVSRSPSHIERAAARLRAGNVYINRPITGAVVGRQPFGGHGLSGVGSQAGGPDYLLQFVDPVTVSENTVRQGFAPPERGGD